MVGSLEGTETLWLSQNIMVFGNVYVQNDNKRVNK